MVYFMVMLYIKETEDTVKKHSEHNNFFPLKIIINKEIIYEVKFYNYNICYRIIFDLIFKSSHRDLLMKYLFGGGYLLGKSYLFEA